MTCSTSAKERFATDADRWRAIMSRDASADGLFVYGVRTTRIYCRPNCKARLPRRANTVFFFDFATAEAAGFRPCKRCRPTVGASMPEDAAVVRIRALLERDLGSEHSPATLAAAANVSRWHFHRKFKEVTGMTPQQYLQSRQQRRQSQQQQQQSQQSQQSHPQQQQQQQQQLPQHATQQQTEVVKLPKTAKQATQTKTAAVPTMQSQRATRSQALTLVPASMTTSAAVASAQPPALDTIGHTELLFPLAEEELQPPAPSTVQSYFTDIDVASLDTCVTPWDMGFNDVCCLADLQLFPSDESPESWGTP